MAKIQNFEDLECWKDARVLVRIIYLCTKQSSFQRDFGLRDQIQRAAVSVMANIAEGFESRSDIEFARYLGIALKSCAEVRSHLYAALDLEYTDTASFDEVYSHAMRCNNKIKAFLKYLRSK